MEKWKAIKDYTNYWISNYGKVKSTKNRQPRILSYVPRENLYVDVQLSENGIVKHHYVHQLVLNYFGPNKPSSKHEINHEDGVKYHNHIDNLSWVTRSQNILHAYRTGLKKPTDVSGKKNPTYGLVRTQEWRDKISKANKGKTRNKHG